jgi:hypothetical protein
MLSNILSAICFCSQQEPEKKTITINFQSKNSKTLPSSVTPENGNFNKQISSSVNNTTLKTELNNKVTKNLKTDFPIKKHIKKNQSCKVNVKIKSLNYEINEKKNKLYKKIKSENNYLDENTYFNNFLLKIDNLIQENLKSNTISESDDIVSFSE